jgi:hypothetical protein
MSLLCSCHKCGKPTPFDRPCQSCGFEDPVYPDTVENVAKKWLEKHENIEPPVAVEPALKTPEPSISPPPPPSIAQPIIAPPIISAPITPQPSTVKKSRPFMLYLNPFVTLVLGLMAYCIFKTEDFVERLIYIIVSVPFLLLGFYMLSIGHDRLLEHSLTRPFWRVLNIFAYLVPGAIMLQYGLVDIVNVIIVLVQYPSVILFITSIFNVGLIASLIGGIFCVIAGELILKRKIL